MNNVVVTSYEIAMNDRAAFQSIMWRYIVVDEGHRLKNMNCRLIKELKQYHSANRYMRCRKSFMIWLRFIFPAGIFSPALRS